MLELELGWVGNLSYVGLGLGERKILNLSFAKFPILFCFVFLFLQLGGWGGGGELGGGSKM
jgi:hypothetical protein